jgi:Glutamate 5-kinase
MFARRRIARDAGIPTLIVGNDETTLHDLARGEARGTLVTVPTTTTPKRKAWIAQQPPLGAIRIDDGAVRALQGGTSLLPRGIEAVEGAFGFGDAVDVVDRQGRPVGRGLSNFAAADLRRIAGAHSRDIATFLGSKDFDEAIHRDNLVMLRERTATTAP